MAGVKEFVRSLYDAFDRGDAEKVLGSLHDEVTWNEAEGNPYADRNPYRSPGEVGEGVFGRLLRDYEGFEVRPRKILADGDEVVVFGRYSGIRKETGESLDAQFVHHWTVKEGEVVRFQQYTDTAQFARLDAESA